MCNFINMGNTNGAAAVQRVVNFLAPSRKAIAVGKLSTGGDDTRMGHCMSCVPNRVGFPNGSAKRSFVGGRVCLSNQNS